jgi:hypothetical protein
MTSKQSRKVAATRFVTSIDMWDLHKFPVETLLRSFESFIAECPANDLTKITSWRMPSHCDEYSTSLEFTEPILGNLTSLHALEVSEELESQKAPLCFVLDRCTSLKQLYYQGTYSYALKTYLCNQPKLQALAVHTALESHETNVAFLFEQLQHRPEIVCILSHNYEESISRHPDWARDAKRVIFSSVMPPYNATLPESIEWFQTSICAPFERSWKLKKYGMDPFSVDCLPVITELILRTEPGKMGPPKEIYETILKFLPPNSPSQVRAAIFHRLLIKSYDILWDDERTANDTIVGKALQDSIPKLLLEEWNVDNKSDWENKYDEIWFTVSSLQKLDRFGVGYRDLEWALCRVEEICEQSRTLIATLDRETLEYCLFSGDASFFRDPEHHQLAKGLLDDLIRKEQYEMLRDLWNLCPSEIGTLNLPREYLDGFHLSDKALQFLIEKPSRLGFTKEEFLARSDLQNFLIRILSDFEPEWYSLPPLPDAVIPFIVNSPELVSRLHRRARVFPDSVPIIAVHLYSLVCRFDDYPFWKPLKQYLDEKLLSQTQHNRSHLQTFWRRLPRTPSALAVMTANLVSHHGLPYKFQSLSISLAHDESLEDHLKIFREQDPLKSLVLIPGSDFDTRRYCDFFDLILPEGSDAEAHAMFIGAVSPHDVTAPLMIIPLVSKLETQFKSTNNASFRFPKAAKVIATWCVIPTLAMVIAEHLTDAAWLDIHGKVMARSQNAVRLLQEMIRQSHFESAYMLMSRGRRTTNELPGYLMTAPRINSLILEPFSFPVVANILCYCKVETDQPFLINSLGAHEKNFAKLFSSNRDLPDMVMVGVWVLLMHADRAVTIDTIAIYARWDPQRVKLLQRASSEVLPLLRETMNVHIITAYLGLMAQRGNWDGFLGSTVYLQKQQYPANDIQQCLDVALMIAFYMNGNLDKARKAAAKFDPEIGPGSYFPFLDPEGIWNILTENPQATKAPLTAAVSSSSTSSSKSSAQKKKKKGNSKRSKNSDSPLSTHSAASLSTPVPSITEEPQIQYEPDTKPSKAPSVQQQASISSSTSPSLPLPPSASPAGMPDPDDDLPDSGPGRLVFVLCSICLDRLPDCVVVPCGHTFCLRCTRGQPACAICRQPIEKWYRFFYSYGEPDMD